MNSKNQSFSFLLTRLWGYISQRRRIQFWILLILMILSSFAEFLNIGAVLPFLGVLIAPEKIYDLPQMSYFIKFFSIDSPSSLLIPAILIFGILIILANAMRMLVVWLSIRLSSSVGAELSYSVYRKTLYQPYLVHASRNSSEVINVVTHQVNYAALTITMMFNLISSAFMLTAIIIAIFILDPLVAIISFGGFGIIYFLIVHTMRARVSNAGHRIAVESSRVLKTLQEGLGGIRDVLLDGTQDTYVSIFHQADTRARRAKGNIEIISFAPRYGVETSGMLLILALAYFLTVSNDGIGSSIPILGALVLGAQRMLPILQLAYISFTGIRGNMHCLSATLDMLDQPMPKKKSPNENFTLLEFSNEIKLSNLAFRYSPDYSFVLKNINLTIPKGARLGVIGKTGSGKSTMLDIVMGLLEPTEGALEVDGLSINNHNNDGWQRHIAHVPQSIYLSDSTIEENIAFGIPKSQIDHARVVLAAKQAQIAETIETWPMKYQTKVGERGIRLSGGQRQRIGIARALYKEASVIIFDEATSALDTETEGAVMQAIESLSKDLTLIIIAHRITTLKNCDQIVELSAGTIKRMGTFAEVTK
jgi:ABC-type multidrug transport system fused ATPase/permease subunit